MVEKAGQRQFITILNKNYDIKRKCTSNKKYSHSRGLIG